MPVAPGRGRKPKPVARKAAAGNPGKRALNKAEPNFGELRNIDAPVWMDGPARDLWELLAPQLCEQRILQMTDVQNLEVYCSAYGRFRLAENEVAMRGLLITDDNGNLKKNPAATIINEAARQMATFGALLGLDPSSRQRLVGAKPAGDGNPFAALLGA